MQEGFVAYNNSNRDISAYRLKIIWYLNLRGIEYAQCVSSLFLRIAVDQGLNIKDATSGTASRGYQCLGR